MDKHQSPALGRLHRFIGAFNSGDPAQYPAMAQADYAKGRQPTAFLRLLYHDTGPLHLVRLDEVTAHSVTALVRTSIGENWISLKLIVEHEEPHSITAVLPNFQARPCDLSPARQGGDEEIRVELSAYVDRLATEDRFSGAVLVARGGRILFQTVKGMASRTYGVPNRLETRFNLGSINKMFTGVAVAQLAQRGLLSFDDPLANHLPDYPADVASKVTIHHLLTHTGGLGSYWNEKWEQARFKVREVADYLPLFQEDPLRFEPGQGWYYSNAGFILLGAVIERVSGQNYFDYIRQHIYRPAGMHNTDCYALDEEPPRIAVGYTHSDGRGGLYPERWFNNTFRHVVKGGPAGGGYATVGDMLRFAEALTENRLLDQHHTELVVTGQVKTDMGPTEWYGYGFTESRLESGRVIGHSGGFAGVNANLDIFLDHGAVAVVLANCDFPAGKRVRDRILERIMQGK